jgi:hypothetical protein
LARLVYIGGYGRSGSTLLEYLLTASPAVVACGEVARHFERFGRIKTCTCGRSMQACPVWSRVQHTSGKLSYRNHETLTIALFSDLSNAYAAMVDSSKTAWGSFLMPFRLRRRLGQNFLLIHLVRDPRAVCWSTIRTATKHKDTRLGSRPMLRCMRTAIGWSLANLASEIFGWRYSEQYMRVHYEQLARCPQRAIAAILERVLLAPPNAEVQSNLDNRHQLYGNSMRFKPLSIQEVREDAAWKDDMPKLMSQLASRLCWPLSSRYGYVC